MVDDEQQETPIEPVNRRPWVRSLILGVVLLLCGGAIGSIITAVTVEERPVHRMRRADRLPKDIAEEMQKRYSLTEEQEQQILPILEEHFQKLRAIRSEVQPRVDAEHEALRHSVEAVLTPEQAEQWRQRFNDQRHLWRPRSEDSSARAEQRP